jgi:hypothetical protein
MIIPLEKLLWRRRQADDDGSASDSEGNRASAENPPSRLIISWFGWGIRDLESFSEDDCQLWARELISLCSRNGFQVERLGGMIDIIVGIPRASVTRHDFFRFQRLFEALNERLGWHLSALLRLAEADDRDTISTHPAELYIDGRIQKGDSIGRPGRHSLREIRSRKNEAMEKKAPEAGGEK